MHICCGAGGEVLPASRVVLAVGHSSRAMYTALLAKGVALSPKPFALGFRVEHPQALIDSIQYGQEYAAGLSHYHYLCTLFRGPSAYIQWERTKKDRGCKCLPSVCNYCCGEVCYASTLPL